MDTQMRTLNRHNTSFFFYFFKGTPRFVGKCGVVFIRLLFKLYIDDDGVAVERLH